MIVLNIVSHLEVDRSPSQRLLRSNLEVNVPLMQIQCEDLSIGRNGSPASLSEIQTHVAFFAFNAPWKGRQNMSSSEIDSNFDTSKGT